MASQREDSPAFYQRIVDAFAKDIDFSPTMARMQALFDLICARAFMQTRPYIVALFCLLLLNTVLQACILWRHVSWGSMQTLGKAAPIP